MTIKENIVLKDYTTFKIGGLARFFCIVNNEDELLEAIGFSKKKKIPYFILGGGSNILVSDRGFSGIVIKMEMKGMSFEENDKGVVVSVNAGESWDDLVKETVERDLYGIENLSGIPGTVGGAPIQNIGAYGTEVKDVIESVYVLDTKKDEYTTLNNVDCQFSYRDSLFKKEKGRYVVMSVKFLLKKVGEVNISYRDLKEFFEKKNIKRPMLKEVREAVIEIRKGKFPDLLHFGTAGSFFKNIIVSSSKADELLKKYSNMIVYHLNNKSVKIPSAWILDNICGFKGFREGEVGVYKNQALVITNFGKAGSEDIIRLADKMSECFFEKTGVRLEREVEHVV